MIVTRDSDYGITFDKQSILNDWLAKEFRERVKKKRKLLLTDRLSTALKLASIPVTKQEVATEKALISARRAAPPKVVNLMEALKRSLDQAQAARRAKAVDFDPNPYEAYEPDPDEPDADPEFDPSDFFEPEEPEPDEPEPDEPEPDVPEPDEQEPDEPEPD